MACGGECTIVGSLSWGEGWIGTLARFGLGSFMLST